MIFTDDQWTAVRAEGNAILEACPGSGKTRCLIGRLHRCLDEVDGTPRRVGCITYTNAGVAEIEMRLRASGRPQLEQYLDVSTIHAFCLNTVLKSFHWLLDEYRLGFTVVAPDSAEYQEILLEVAPQFHLRDRDLYEFSQARRSAEGEPLVPPGGVPPRAVTAFWETLAANNLVDFSSILYHSYCLLRDHPELADAVAAKYAWMLVDEFQDTTRLQVEILRLIADRGRTSFFIVGDPQQSIFGFAGAEPALVPGFAEAIGAETLPGLAENFRSSEPLVSLANRLIPREPEMVAAGPNRDCAEGPVIIRGLEAPDAVLRGFLPRLDEMGIPYGRAAVLSPVWFALTGVGRRLREHGIQVMGPGSRPYRGTFLIGSLAEQIAAYLAQPEAERLRRVERELFEMVGRSTGESPYGIYSFSGRRLAYSIIGIARRARDGGELADDWLREVAREVADALVAEDLITPSEAEQLPESADEMLRDAHQRMQGRDQLTVEDLGLFAASKDSVRLLTLHAAKGREFDAVAIIEAYEGRIPHYRARSTAELEEARRVLYVGMTRAKRLLLFCTHDSSRHRNPPSRFLREQYLGLL